MAYLATSINKTAVIAEKAGAAIEDVRGKAVKFDAEGNIALCSAGEVAIGVGIMTNDESTATGQDVDIQIKDIGLVRAGAPIAKGAELSVGAGGMFVPATDGDFVCAIALDSANDSGTYIKARLVAYRKGVAKKRVETTTVTALKKAIESSKEATIITIAADTKVSAPLKVAEGQDITLEIPAGVTLTLAAGTDNYGIVAKGTVTVRGEGDIVLSGYGFGTSMNTEGKLIIKSGHFIAQGCDYILGCFDGEIIIEGGQFDAEYCVVNNFSETYKTDGKVTITGGTFNTSDPEGFDVLGNYVAISGGQFSKPVNEAHCAEGYKPATADGYYTVTR